MTFCGSGKPAIFRSIDVPVCEAKSYFLDQSFFYTQGCLLCFNASNVNTFERALNGIGVFFLNLFAKFCKWFY